MAVGPENAHMLILNCLIRLMADSLLSVLLPAVKVRVHISALVNNTDKFYAGMIDLVEHDISALGKATRSWPNIIPLSAHLRISGQIIETGKESREIGLGLLEAHCSRV